MARIPGSLTSDSDASRARCCRFGGSVNFLAILSVAGGCRRWARG